MLIEIIEDNIFGSLTSYNTPNNLMSASSILRYAGGSKTIHRSLNSLYSFDNIIEGDRLALAILSNYDLLPREFLRFIFAMIDSGRVSDQLINDILLNSDLFFSIVSFSI